MNPNYEAPKKLISEQTAVRRINALLYHRKQTLHVNRRNHFIARRLGSYYIYDHVLESNICNVNIQTLAIRLGAIDLSFERIETRTPIRAINVTQ